MSSGFRDGQEEEAYVDMEGDREFAGRQENREAPFSHGRRILCRKQEHGLLLDNQKNPLPVMDARDKPRHEFLAHRQFW